VSDSLEHEPSLHPIAHGLNTSLAGPSVTVERTISRHLLTVAEGRSRFPGVGLFEQNKVVDPAVRKDKH